MAICVSTSWKRFAEAISKGRGSVITNPKAHLTLRMLFCSWKQNNSSPQQISTAQESQSNLALMKVAGCSVGAKLEVNCNEFKTYDMVTKKNTQICRLSVLSAVRYASDQRIVLIPSVAYRKNRSNFFVEYYV